MARYGHAFQRLDWFYSLIPECRICVISTETAQHIVAFNKEYPVLEPNMDKYETDQTQLGWNFCVLSFASLISLTLDGYISKLSNNNLSKQKLLNIYNLFLPSYFKIASDPLFEETNLSFCFALLFWLPYNKPPFLSKILMPQNLEPGFSVTQWTAGPLSRYSGYYYTFTLTRLPLK